MMVRKNSHISPTCEFLLLKKYVSFIMLENAGILVLWKGISGLLVKEYLRNAKGRFNILVPTEKVIATAAFNLLRCF